ncbi:DUF6895 family protein [Streptococcus troglodytae]|uniref:DUF6895 domain-containing protein n=1 Tax=Streptococcus troglodytae TaxID=1111760 RepID=A0A1L7LM13_9STRE|nr:hypothetical protein [Streptococcus troglodytae]BAQ25199.1 uncharacterized protein SRT_19380 [Streptococcus troglodytae]
METSIVKAVDYLRRNIDYFLVEEHLKYNSESEMKSFIELAFLYNFWTDSMKERYNLYFIRDYILSKIETNDFEEESYKNIITFSGIATMEEFLLSEGVSKYNHFLKEMVNEKKLDVLTERTPFRVMDVKYSLNKANIKDNLPSYEKLFKKTVLGKGLPFYYMTPTTLYSITHTLFYITDMGRSYCLEYPINNIAFILRVLMGERIIEKDLDILGELVLDNIFLDIRETSNVTLVDYAIHKLIDNQMENGLFPAPQPLKTRNGYKEFRYHYHTTLVCLGALLCYQEWKK